MLDIKCTNCGRATIFTSVLRPKCAVLRFFVMAVTASLFVGNLRGDKVSTLASNVTTTKDMNHKNDNFRKRYYDGDITENTGENYLENKFNDLILNNHRKSLFDRNEVLPEDRPIEFTSSWAVRLPEHLHSSGRDIVLGIANEFGLQLHGNIGHLDGHYLLTHNTFFNHTPHADDALKEFRQSITEKLNLHPHVEWVEHEKVLQRQKRLLEFKDEFFPSQWHLDNLKFIGHDINVTGVWERNITGSGVTVSVIDDGVQWNNPDILDNYSSDGSWDLNSNDPDPMPRLDDAGLNHHGTRCAGEIAAVANEVCGVGVAFGAKISGIRILDGPMTDSLEAMAFNTKSDVNDIYSCSWGPDDNGRTVDGPHQLAQAALAHGVIQGRRGFGSIYVVASGNGGHFKDNCNFDGYANSIFTVTIGAVDELGQMPYYAEQCAAMLAVTYSSGQGHQRNIVTTDWTLGSGTGCTDKHTGTSAAAPLAAGMIALMLEARPCLTWRDVQHIIVYTARRVDIEPDEWHVNGAGFSHSHKHGFGLLDSWALVTTSKMWTNVPFLTSWSSRVMNTNDPIPVLPGFNLTKVINVRSVGQVTTLEHVTVTLNIKHPSRGSLLIKLVSPSGVVSRLASLRKYDKSKEGFRDWTFSTVRYWGEQPRGVWRLHICDQGGGDHEKGVLKSWRITFYGSMQTPHEIQERKKLVKKAMSGRFLNKPGPPCPLPPFPQEKKEVLSTRTLKVILLLSGFFFLVGIYFVLETLCAIGNKEELTKAQSQPLKIKVEKTSEVKRDKEAPINKMQCAVDMTTPDDLELDSFISNVTLTKEDELRLSNIIEFGTSRPTTPTMSTLSFFDSGSLELLNITNPVTTPDESVRVKEFEERMQHALEESMKLQQMQMSHIDNLQRQCQNMLDEQGCTIDMFSVGKPNQQKKKKKLKGILKKPKSLHTKAKKET